MRVHGFLEQWGLVNYQVRHSTTNLALLTFAWFRWIQTHGPQLLFLRSLDTSVLLSILLAAYPTSYILNPNPAPELWRFKPTVFPLIPPTSTSAKPSITPLLDRPNQFRPSKRPKLLPMELNHCLNFNRSAVRLAGRTVLGRGIIRSKTENTHYVLLASSLAVSHPPRSPATLSVSTRRYSSMLQREL